MSVADEQKGGPPPWINPAMQQEIQWRDRDIVISVPIKSGTTWMMNIVYQLLQGGDPDFEDIYGEVPWIEFVTHKGMTLADLEARIGAMPTDIPRAFKTHAAPPDLPYHPPASDVDVRYIVVCRNPEEALVSVKPFIEKHADELFEYWGMPKGALTRSDFPTFYREVIDGGGFNAALFAFIQAWWPLRHNPNVLMLHFADMKRDHEGSIRKVADFLGIAPTDDRWPTVLEYTSFPWMKAHDIKFDGTTMGAVQVLQPGAMVRRGVAGGARDDGMTEAIAEHLREKGRAVCPDEAARTWLYEGGPLPG